MAIISKIVDNSDQVWKYLVCPFKLNYGLESLGPPTQAWANTTYDKIEGSVKNDRGNSMVYSFYQARGIKHEKSFTVVYLHSHGACRVEGYHLLRVCGIYGVSLCLFDFAGCGHSEGEFISMGIYEKNDTCVLMDHLQVEFGVQHFAVWGRSMGAATALQAYPNLKNTFALVLDSPFTTVRSVYRNAVKQKVALPDMITDMIFSYASSEIVSHYGFDVNAIRPYEVGPRVNIPTVLIGTREDKITDYGDLLELYSVLAIDDHNKVIVECKGQHNDDRDQTTLKNTLEFLANVYGIKPLTAGGFTNDMSAISRPASPDVGLRKDNARSVDPRQRSQTGSLGGYGRGMEALKKLSALGGISGNSGEVFASPGEDISEGVPPEPQRKTVMDYTYQGLNSGAVFQERSRRESYNKRLRNNRSVNTARPNAGLGLFVDKPISWNTQNQEVNSSRTRPSNPVNYRQDMGGGWLKPSGSQQFSLGNLYPQAATENINTTGAFNEKKQNILGFLDNKVKEKPPQADQNQSMPVIQAPFQKDSYNPQQQLPKPSPYKPILVNQTQNGPNLHSNNSNQGPVIASNLKSAYRPFTLGPRKQQDQGTLIRNAKSFKHYNDEMLQVQPEMQEYVHQHPQYTGPTPQNIVEPNFQFNPLYSGYGSGSSRPTNPQQFVPQNHGQSEKRQFQGSLLNPLNFVFTSPPSNGQQQFAPHDQGYSQRLSITQTHNQGNQPVHQQDMAGFQVPHNYFAPQNHMSQQNHTYYN